MAEREHPADAEDASSGNPDESPGDQHTDSPDDSAGTDAASGSGSAADEAEATTPSGGDLADGGAAMDAAGGDSAGGDGPAVVEASGGDSAGGGDSTIAGDPVVTSQDSSAGRAKLRRRPIVLVGLGLASVGVIAALVLGTALLIDAIADDDDDFPPLFSHERIPSMSDFDAKDGKGCRGDDDGADRGRRRGGSAGDKARGGDCDSYRRGDRDAEGHRDRDGDSDRCWDGDGDGDMGEDRDQKRRRGGGWNGLPEDCETIFRLGSGDEGLALLLCGGDGLDLEDFEGDGFWFDRPLPDGDGFWMGRRLPDGDGFSMGRRLPDGDGFWMGRRLPDGDGFWFDRPLPEGDGFWMGRRLPEGDGFQIWPDRGPENRRSIPDAFGFDNDDIEGLERFRDLFGGDANPEELSPEMLEEFLSEMLSEMFGPEGWNGWGELPEGVEELDDAEVEAASFAWATD